MIETVRGHLNGALSEELLDFWARHGFSGEQARQRLPDVICVLRADGAIAGVSSAFQSEVGLIANRRFWIYRSLLPGPAGERQLEMIKATFDALDAEPHDAPGAPVGLCILLDETQWRRLPPEAEWPQPRTFYAGYLQDGRQVRVAYFSDQVSSMAVPTQQRGLEPDPGYSIEWFSRQERLTAQDLLDLWTSEGALPPEEAERRVGEVAFIASDTRGRPAAITTLYIARNAQLGAHFWYFRALVAAAHRKSNIAVSLVQRTRDHVEQLYLSGEDRRAIGFIMEIENEGLKRAFSKPIWYESDAVFVGENARGAYVLVHYFPGVRAPEPLAPGPQSYGG